ncbi:electron transport complex subunit RsxB [Rhodoferax antarcticus]|uniref:Electron transport complex, RnfABCDGE type, B subunit n=1 Tax=Rhodoferax antarcticus ANT.BR TaxID=1111071 RepID=A0A1Q8YF92_9BURK|nr:electron transport complex subunit RsxB [Rhodoferax antarcticus]APW46451.1 ferredoxin [Rhodoferax antarcticus]OLP06714.1 electron transport complex, RnfABCDGE type, B subunit [Rhodoferax antarcticus ANT.BR]
MTSLAARLLAALPQTQCTRCGYPDCAAYAMAVACGEAAINQCPPGGAEGVAKLAAITGQPVVALNPANGPQAPRSMMFIDEDWCIGCTLCIKACPVDAIIGSNKLMHTVLEAHCTGCALCLPVCPVDCILVENASGNATGWAAWSQDAAEQARDSYAFHSYRVKRDEGENDNRPEEKAQMKLADLEHQSQHTDPVVLDKKRAVIEAALARARAKREAIAANSG